MQKQMQELFHVLQNKEESVTLDAIDNEQYYSLNGQKIVYLSVSDNSSTRAYVIQGAGETVEAAVNQAISVYLSERPAKFKPKHVKLDIVKSIKNTDQKQEEAWNKHVFKYHDQGVTGIAFGEDFSQAFSPQEIEGYLAVSRKKLNTEALTAAAEQRLPAHTVDLEDVKTVVTFEVEAYYTDGTETYPLIRGHRTYEELNKEQLAEAIQLTRDNYFKKAVNDKGKFTYIFYPATNFKENKYNILRHAGSIYAMLEIHEMWPDEELLEKAELAIDFIVDKVEEDSVNGEAAKVLVERDTVKLGGNGLLVVALAKHAKVTGSEKYIPLMQELARWMELTQKDNGDFSIHKQMYTSKEVTDFRSDFYTGEAILALARLYELDHQEKWLDIAEKATEYLVEVAYGGATIDTVTSDHWLMYGINALSQYRTKDSFMSHAVLTAKALIRNQFHGEDYPVEWQGGYPPQVGEHPKSVPNACKTEGLTNVYAMLNEEDQELKDQLRNTIRHSLQFQLQLQVRPEKAMYFSKKSLSLGAFHNKFRVIELRNDFTQHNISSAIALYKIL